MNRELPTALAMVFWEFLLSLMTAGKDGLLFRILFLILQCIVNCLNYLFCIRSSSNMEIVFYLVVYQVWRLYLSMHGCHLCPSHHRVCGMEPLFFAVFKISDRVRDRKGDIEQDSLVHSPGVHNGQGRDRSQGAMSRSFTWASGAQTLGSSSAAFLGLSRELERSGVAPPIWKDSTAYSGFTHKARVNLGLLA